MKYYRYLPRSCTTIHNQNTLVLHRFRESPCFDRFIVAVIDTELKPALVVSLCQQVITKFNASILNVPLFKLTVAVSLLLFNNLPYLT